MGAAVGAALVGNNNAVFWSADGRSGTTGERAKAAGLTETANLDALLDKSGVVFSVCPPGAALAVASSVADAGFGGIYVDANAVSPETAREIAALIDKGGAGFVDGGIVGGPPRSQGQTRLLLSGGEAPDIAALFDASGFDAVVIGSGAGAASAVKMAYAAYTKGTAALVLAIRAVARAEGVEDALLAEWTRSQQGIVERSERAAASSRKAWRWVAEMGEIASTFEAVGLPDGFHLAAADVFARLEGFKDQTGDIDEVLKALLAD